MADAPAIQAVIFDRDGVLARFSPERAARLYAGLYPGDLAALERDVRAQAAREGEPRGREARAAFWRRLWADVAARDGLPAASRRALEAIRPEAALEPYPDALPALAHLRSLGLKIGVLSNFSLIDLAASLEALGLAPWIDAALSASDLGVAKPDPAAYQAIADALRIPPKRCLHLDDRPACVEGARRAGMAAALVDRSGATAGALRDLADLRALAGRVFALSLLTPSTPLS